MELTFSGGAMEIGGSCIYLRADGKGILLDCGIRQGGSRDPIPDFRSIQQAGGVDAVLVSHAHMDHTGTLPVISKAYPQAPIYMTAMTADLVRVLLSDSLKIMNRWEGEIPHYAQEDVTAMLNRIRPINFRSPFPIFDQMTVTLYPAGHIAGAACIYLETREGTLFYSGDFCSFPQKTIEGIHIPKLRPDVAIVETTYGDRLHSNRQVEETNLVNLVGECVRRGDKVLIPAFALGRSQEVLLLLKAAVQNGQIPPVPVYVDGMVRDINSMYERNPIYLRSNLGRSILKGNAPFYTKEITAVKPDQNRDDLVAQKGPAVFVASSGMLSGGPSVQYAKKIASMENGCIIITGYQDEESPGRQLTNLLEGAAESEEAGTAQRSNGAAEDKTRRTLTLDQTTVPVRCGIHRAGLSAHGDKNEILGLLERLSPRDLFLVHGDREVIQGFGRELGGDYRRRVWLPECGGTYELNYRSKRKQLHENLSSSMQRQEALDDASEEQLWQYILEHYPAKDLTCEQISFVWSGKRAASEEELARLQGRLLTSPYFSTNPRRLFLFRANSQEEVQQNLAPKELTPQQLELKIRELFSGLVWKKISFHQEQRRAVLNFDFPDVVNPENFRPGADTFYENTGWKIEISPSVNHAAASLLLAQLFGGRIGKTSYFADQKCYHIQLRAGAEGDLNSQEIFQQTTGWTLGISEAGGAWTFPTGSADNSTAKTVIGSGDAGGASRPGSGSIAGSSAADLSMFLPEDNCQKPMEQNMVQYYADQAFQDQRHRIYKKSIKTDADGRYLELSFLSPEVGKRYGNLLARLASETQWRIRISDSVNQKEIFETALILCGRYGITLRQNPSYLPQRRTVQVRTLEIPAPEIRQTFVEEMKEITGLGCEVVG